MKYCTTLLFTLAVLMCGSLASAQCGGTYKSLISSVPGSATITPPKSTKRVYLRQVQLTNDNKQPEILPTSMNIGPIIDNANLSVPDTLLYDFASPAGIVSINTYLFASLIHGPLGAPITITVNGPQASLIYISAARCYAP